MVGQSAVDDVLVEYGEELVLEQFAGQVDQRQIDAVPFSRLMPFSST